MTKEEGLLYKKMLKGGCDFYPEGSVENIENPDWIFAEKVKEVLDEAKQDFPLDEIRKDIRQQCLHMGNADPILLKVRSWFINHFGGVDEAQRKNEYYTDDSTRINIAGKPEKETKPTGGGE